MKYKRIFNENDIVYWCHNCGNGRYRVDYGMVFEQFSDGVCIDYLVPKETRLVNGIPYEEFQSETRYKKLPKGWTYDTKLFEITNRELTEEEKNTIIDIKNPESIKSAYDKGILVKRSLLNDKKIEEDITKDGYRIVVKYEAYNTKPNNTSVRPDRVYKTYDEAKNEVDTNIAEFQRQASLTDKEWSLEQIKHTTDRYEQITGNSGTPYYEWLAEMDNVEDIETRIYGLNVQWRYWKNKRWNNIEL